ncbi:hypothetical protein V5799_003604 [Amblyomma americanum]|uniref:Uncharacterized protein n=1 Tax=Amblyomma americanum TaxID=6943 RepID=A0AAQ4D8G0_AMBAM
MNYNVLIWLYVKLENMLMTTHHWIMSALFQDLRSHKYVASFSASFMIVGILVLLVSLALVWTPSVWNLKRPRQAASKLELTPYKRTELADKQSTRALPNFLPDSNDLEVTEEEIVDVYNHLPARKPKDENGRNGSLPLRIVPIRADCRER